MGWFKPAKKMRISKTKDMYKPADGKAMVGENSCPNKFCYLTLSYAGSLWLNYLCACVIPGIKFQFLTMGVAY